MLDGKKVATEPRARPMVVEVFATWCEICTSEIPTLNRLKLSHPEVDVVAVTGSNKGVDFDSESPSSLARYRSQAARAVSDRVRSLDGRRT